MNPMLLFLILGLFDPPDDDDEDNDSHFTSYYTSDDIKWDIGDWLMIGMFVIFLIISVGFVSIVILNL